jgi:hypothetical protein
MKFLKDIKLFNEKVKKIEKLIFLSIFLKNKKIILKTLEETNNAGKLLLTSIIKYVHLKGQITIQNEPKENIKILKNISKKWEIEKEIEKILTIFKINKKHKNSPIEFIKKGSVIILDEKQNIEKINIKILKNTLKSIKTVKKIFSGKINTKNF